MAVLAVVEGLDVFEDGGTGLLPGGSALAVEQLGLEGGEEAVGDGTVPAGAVATDTLADVTVGVEADDRQAPQDRLGHLLVAWEAAADQLDRWLLSEHSLDRVWAGAAAKVREADPRQLMSAEGWVLRLQLNKCPAAVKGDRAVRPGVPLLVPADPSVAPRLLDRLGRRRW